MKADDREKKQLYEWACSIERAYNDGNCFTSIDKRCKSYYEKRSEEGSYLKEYSYTTLPELRYELEKLWKDESDMLTMIPCILTASIRNKTVMNVKDERESQKVNEEQLKPYIYNF